MRYDKRYDICYVRRFNRRYDMYSLWVFQRGTQSAFSSYMSTMRADTYRRTRSAPAAIERTCQLRSSMCASACTSMLNECSRTFR